MMNSDCNVSLDSHGSQGSLVNRDDYHRSSPAVLFKALVVESLHVQTEAHAVHLELYYDAKREREREREQC